MPKVSPPFELKEIQGLRRKIVDKIATINEGENSRDGDFKVLRIEKPRAELFVSPACYQFWNEEMDQKIIVDARINDEDRELENNAELKKESGDRQVEQLKVLKDSQKTENGVKIEDFVT